MSKKHCPDCKSTGPFYMTPTNNMLVECSNCKKILPLHSLLFQPTKEMNKSSFAPHPVDIPDFDQERREDILNKGGTEFSTGAVRSSDKAGVMYHLITPIGLRRIAETYKEGYDKYGAFNWEKGMPIGDILNHAIAHIYAYLENPNPSAREEDDLAHAAWNLLAAMHMEETHLLNPAIDHQLRKSNPPAEDLMT